MRSFMKVKIYGQELLRFFQLPEQEAQYQAYIAGQTVVQSYRMDYDEDTAARDTAMTAHKTSYDISMAEVGIL